MKKFFTICAALGALSGLGLADNWSGTLLDAHCAARKSNEPCYAKRSSSHYVLDVNGTKYRLDGPTTTDVRSAMVEQKIKMKNGAPMATITGTVRKDGRIHGHTIAVENGNGSSMQR